MKTNYLLKTEPNLTENKQDIGIVKMHLIENKERLEYTICRVIQVAVSGLSRLPCGEQGGAWPFPPFRYSIRNAAIGSMRAARRAGT